MVRWVFDICGELVFLVLVIAIWAIICLSLFGLFFLWSTFWVLGDIPLLRVLNSHTEMQMLGLGELWKHTDGLGELWI